MRGIIQLVAIALLIISGSASAQVFSGSAEVIDGDSLIVDGREVRLFGIDAPELTQTCQTDGEEWQCGEEAKRNLEALVRNQRVECSSHSVDIHGRLLSVCHAGGFPLNATMVDYGWATAYREYSSDYLPNEVRARAARAGIWRSVFVLPSGYRHAASPPEERQEPRRQPQTTDQTERSEPAGCVIKGNRSRRGEWIYHLPGMPYYNVTRAEEMFCTEAEARAAGYRRAIVH